jgi:hypothetical protein
MVLTNDNSRVFFNIAGEIYSLDTATDTVYYNPNLFGSDYELTLSSNQTWMSAGEYLMDTNLNPESYVFYVDRETWNQSSVYGQKISADGNLLFQPLLNAIDVLDGRQGGLRTRVAIPVTLSPNYDALVSDGKDDVIVAITGQSGDGIAVIDLSSLPEPVSSASAIASRNHPLPVAKWTLQATRKPLTEAQRRALGSTERPSLRLPHVTKSLVRRTIR